MSVSANIDIQQITHEFLRATAKFVDRHCSTTRNCTTHTSFSEIVHQCCQSDERLNLAELSLVATFAPEALSVPAVFDQADSNLHSRGLAETRELMKASERRWS